LLKDTAGSYVSVDENFERAWRRVGLALDRAGFTVEDRDRAQGVYFVRYVAQEQDEKVKSANEKGFLSRLFSSDSSSDKMKAVQRYRVLVKKSDVKSAKDANDVNNVTTKITVLNGAGKIESSSSVDKILSLLKEQLK
jgi:outer membrane protein assembly factor BamC